MVFGFVRLLCVVGVFSKMDGYQNLYPTSVTAPQDEAVMANSKDMIIHGIYPLWENFKFKIKLG